MPQPTAGDAPERLPAGARREALLDVALALVRDRGPQAVSMGAVAERAELTRALVYKHFANKEDLLAALYRREAGALDRALRGAVAAAPDGFEAKLRAFARGALAATGTHGPVLASLRGFGRDAAFRRERRSWDRRTVGYFAGLAAAEYGLDESVARPAVRLVLGAVDALLAQAQPRGGARRRAFLEDLFVEMAQGSLARLAERPPAPP